MSTYDILLQNGMVLDGTGSPAQKLDIAIKDGVIAAVEKYISADSAKRVLDVKDLIVTPGLVDMHCHIFPHFPQPEKGLPTIDPEAHLYQSGVTAAVDTGTCGWKHFQQFKEQVIDPSDLKIFAFINIAAEGMVYFPSEQNVNDFEIEPLVKLCEKYPREVVGIKTAHYWHALPPDEEHPTWASVDATLEAAEACNTIAMFDFQENEGRTYKELILEKLRPGDIHTHVFAQQFPVITDDKKVNEIHWQARERGVVFDLGHGAGSFWFRQAVPAYQQGFYPDTISSDLYFSNVVNPVINLLHIMSKYLNIGMPIEEVIHRTTRRPAEVIKRTDIGTLDIGARADVAVLKVQQGNFAFSDAGGARMDGDKRLECHMTICNGKVKYNPYAIGLPQWETAPEEYWRPPGIIG